MFRQSIHPSNPLWNSDWISHFAYTSGQWTVEYVFRVFSLYWLCKMFWISFSSRIGLPDKLVQVSSPILLALQPIDIKESQCMFSTAAVTVVCCLFANKISKTWKLCQLLFLNECISRLWEVKYLPLAESAWLSDFPEPLFDTSKNYCQDYELNSPTWPRGNPRGQFVFQVSKKCILPTLH